MVTKTKEMHTCEVCAFTGEGVLEYPTHKNGYDTTEYQCTDVHACLARKEAYRIGRAEIEKKHPHFFEP